MGGNMDNNGNRGPSQGAVAPPRLLESLRAAMGAQHYSRRAEQRVAEYCAG
jgi:hypothetical protein